jgi:hypothetical protein
MKLLAFDVELDQLLSAPSKEAWKDGNVPHITCAAVSDHNGVVQTWWGQPYMKEKELASLVDTLYAHFCAGGLIVTWGGTAADFRALYENLKSDPLRQNQCYLMVQNHIDIPLAAATDTGMMMGLRAAVQGMCLGNKDAESSSLAPEKWAEGKISEVLAHVQKDATMTASVYLRTLECHPARLTWVTRKGHKQSWFPLLVPFHSGMRMCTVWECMMRAPKVPPFQIPEGMHRDDSCRWLLSSAPVRPPVQSPTQAV